MLLVVIYGLTLGYGGFLHLYSAFLFFPAFFHHERATVYDLNFVKGFHC